MLSLKLPISLPFSYKGFRNINFDFTLFYCVINTAEIFNGIIADGLSLKDHLFPVLRDCLQGFTLNILLFIPFGCLLAINVRKSNVLKVMLGSFIFSSSLEILQLIEVLFSLTHVRVFDIDDIIANAIGVITGFFFAILLPKIMKIEVSI
ncbi:VanZ [Thermoclostridium stercorarium subsp. stercorarium DSM 8532]|nr:VanZ family protein [Thermoclostridium stercorarium]AGI40079.1 VanZ [Thermoclostridium stercorarium subsp. stercorarium DSM 8532]